MKSFSATDRTMRIRKLKSCLIFLLLVSACCLPLVVFYGCASREAPEAAHIKTVIAKYNNALIEAYRNRNPAPLREVAGDDEVRKIGIIVDSFLQSGEIMEAELLSMEFKEMKVEADKAVVRTSEDWKYRWVNIKSGKEAEPVTDVHYAMLYHMVKKDGKWIVDKVVDESKGRASSVTR